MEEKTVAVRKKAEVVLASEQLPSIREAIELAPMLVQSGMFPGVTKPPEAVAKILLGREMGVGPVTSLQLIDVVRGRLRPRAQLIATLLKRSGRYDYRIKKLEDDECIIEFLDRGKIVHEARWTMKDAERAGVVKPDSAWKTYPREMLFSRAMSTGALKVCPEVLGGAEPLEINGGFDVVEGQVAPEGEPSPDAWKAFWAATSELGYNEQEVHNLLDVVSIKDWLAHGQSLEDGLVLVRHAAADRDRLLWEEQNSVPSRPETVTPPGPQEKGDSRQSEGDTSAEKDMRDLISKKVEALRKKEGDVPAWCNDIDALPRDKLGAAIEWFKDK